MQAKETSAQALTQKSEKTNNTWSLKNLIFSNLQKGYYIWIAIGWNTTLNKSKKQVSFLPIFRV